MSGIDEEQKEEEECWHQWVYDEDWENDIELDECLRIPMHCKLCGKEAHEVWCDSIIADRNTGEMIE